MDKLAKELRDIEKALGGDETLPDSYYKSDDKLGWHLDYIEDLIEEGGGSKTFKTIDGESIEGEGNIITTTYLTTAPTEANTSGKIIFVVLSEEPATKYDGYLYIITSAQE